MIRANPRKPAVGSEARPPNRVTLAGWQSLPCLSECADPLFRSLVGLLGEQNSLDAYHIFTAEMHGLNAFLHFDLKLDRHPVPPSHEQSNLYA